MTQHTTFLEGIFPGLEEEAWALDAEEVAHLCPYCCPPGGRAVPWAIRVYPIRRGIRIERCVPCHGTGIAVELGGSG